MALYRPNQNVSIPVEVLRRNEWLLSARLPLASSCTIRFWTATGRKSGEQRSVLLIHADDGDDFIVVGSNWGMDKPPAWPLNLKASPEARVTITPNEYSVRAEHPEGDEGERCWNLLVDVVPQLPDVAANANRILPIVKLVRT